MARLIYVPIERLPERYSAQWDDWFREAFKREGIEYIAVGDSLTREIRVGQFLDAVETNAYKARQLSQIMDSIQKYGGKEPITVFFMDLWFPGLEAIAYIRDATGWDIRITGMLHAGTYDPADFLYQKKMGRWARSFEESFLRCADTVFVASQFHVELLRAAGLPTARCRFVEWPVETAFRKLEKEPLVVFPHRLAPEKRPDLFKTLQTLWRARYGGTAEWVRTKDVWTTKDAYYALLERAAVAVSTAEQETFGIAMAEANNAGCFCVVPNRLSYRELFWPANRYDTLEQAVDLIEHGLRQCNVERPHPINPKAKEIPWVREIF